MGGNRVLCLMRGPGDKDDLPACSPGDYSPSTADTDATSGRWFAHSHAPNAGHSRTCTNSTSDGR